VIKLHRSAHMRSASHASSARHHQCATAMKAGSVIGWPELADRETSLSSLNRAQHRTAFTAFLRPPLTPIHSPGGWRTCGLNALIRGLFAGITVLDGMRMCTTLRSATPVWLSRRGSTRVPVTRAERTCFALRVVTVQRTDPLPDHLNHSLEL